MEISANYRLLVRIARQSFLWFLAKEKCLNCKLLGTFQITIEQRGKKKSKTAKRNQQSFSYFIYPCLK